mmetsp:Transcript_30609/g.66022  ORF Transcript_30609/g.66022 Transcript_30609/m.66022 type:complete len:225 (-) Transcript_30609:26-700(-)
MNPTFLNAVHDSYIALLQICGWQIEVRPVAQTRAMQEQMSHCHLRLCRDRGGSLCGLNQEAFEGRDEFVHRVVQHQLTSFHQHHRGKVDEWFRGTINSANCVVREGGPAFQIGKPEAFFEHSLALVDGSACDPSHDSFSDGRLQSFFVSSEQSFLLGKELYSLAFLELWGPWRPLESRLLDRDCLSLLGRSHVLAPRLVEKQQQTQLQQEITTTKNDAVARLPP